MGSILNFVYALGMEPEIDLEIFLSVMNVVSSVLSSGVSVLAYVLMAWGVFSIAKRRGIRNPWMAWIPFADVWMLGCISDQYQYVVKGKIRNRRKTLLGLEIALVALVIPFIICWIAFIVAVVGSLMSDWEIGVAALVFLGVFLGFFALAIVQSVCLYKTCFDLFRSCKPDNAVAFLVLSIIFSFLMPFFIFACRNSDLGMPPRKDRIPEQPAAPAEPEVQIIDILPEVTEEPTEE